MLAARSESPSTGLWLLWHSQDTCDSVGKEGSQSVHEDEESKPICAVIPSVQKLLPTGIFILGNYLEIGNALPYRKICFQELFGPVIVIKSVMENLAGKVPFLFVLGTHFRESFR